MWYSGDKTQEDIKIQYSKKPLLKLTTKQLQLVPENCQQLVLSLWTLLNSSTPSSLNWLFSIRLNPLSLHFPWGCNSYCCFRLRSWLCFFKLCFRIEATYLAWEEAAGLQESAGWWCMALVRFGRYTCWQNCNLFYRTIGFPVTK